VLIPRPETETLVEGRARAHGPDATRCSTWVTGSGAVAVTIACQRPESRVVATDVSDAALRVARTNAERHRCAERVELLKGSWYEPLGNRTFDVIVSNPPYVAAGDPHLGSGDLRFEPREALTDGSRDGLARSVPSSPAPPTT
jgi:release factor glutamine methyltransferase